MNIPGKSIAASPMDPAMVEATVKRLLEQRDSHISCLSDDILQRIQIVRDICKHSEQVDGNGAVGWRRGGSTHKPSSNGKGQSNHRWHNHNNNHTHSHVDASVFPIRPTTATTTSNDTPSVKGSHRYVSKFKNSELPVEDKILNQVILNKLNKFGKQNYDSIKQFLKQILDSDETEFLNSFMLLVFKKAAVEPTFCPLYAKLVSELSIDYPSFKKGLYDLYTNYLDIFEEVSEDQVKNYEEYVERNRKKIHRLGYSQFLAELTGHGILELDQLSMLYIKITDEIKRHARTNDKQHIIEEYVACLVKMTKSFEKSQSSDVLCDLCKQLGTACEPILEDILSNRTSLYPGLSTKGEFGIMDCLDIFRAVPK